MTRAQSQGVKVVSRSHPGTIRLDDRPRIPPSQPPVAIAPRPFVYKTLQPGEIRLVEISPSRDRSAPIQTTLKHQRLRCGSFEALSRALESDEQRAKIHVNGQPIEVNGSLLEALRDIRREIEPRTLWVDSICVNQNDRKEKEEQLMRVTEIYGQATFVIPWIGGNNGERIADEEALEPFLTIGKVSSPSTWNTNLPQIRDIGSEHLFDVSTYQHYYESPPALTSNPGSPLTNSASPSPGTLADFKVQAAPCPESFPIHPGSTELWAASLQGPGLPQLSPGDGMLVDVASTSPRKRSQVAAFPDDLPAPCNQKMQQTKSISADSNDKGLNVAFACPFQKSDPHKYHKCLKYTLTRIKDVKQHIYRQHTQRPYYCARCYTFFTTNKDRDEHCRRADCETQDPPQFEGITDNQRNELKKSSPKKKPLQEQWFEVWDVVFPGRPRPLSAFIGNYVEEMIPLLRDLWNEKSAEIISGVIETRGGRDEVDSGLLADIMNSVFDRFLTEKTLPSRGNSIGRAGSPGITTFQLAAQHESDFCFELEAPFGQQEFSQMSMPDFDTGCAVDYGNYFLPLSPDSCG